MSALGQKQAICSATPCPLYPHKQTFAVSLAMSAKGLGRRGIDASESDGSRKKRLETWDFKTMHREANVQ